MRFLRKLILAGGVAGVLLLPATGVLAHANLARSDPQANASLASAPTQVRLWFTERPEIRLSDVRVFNAQRARVDQGAATPAPDDQLSLLQSLQPNLPQGVYTVSWQTTSAVDGHVTGGAFAFGIGTTPTAADLLAAPVREQPSSGTFGYVVRWLSYLGLVGLFGLLLFPVWVLPAASATTGSNIALLEWKRQVIERCLVTARFLAAIALVASLEAIPDQIWRSTARFDASALGITLGTGLGLNLIARCLVAGAIVAILFSRLAQAETFAPASYQSLGAAAAASFQPSLARQPLGVPVLVLLALAELLLLALGGHATTVQMAPDLALFIDWLHLAAAGVWMGGLIALCLAVMPLAGGGTKPSAPVNASDVELNGFFGPVLAQFSRIALAAAVCLLITGLYQAVIHVGSFENLLSTDYGRSLIVKSLLFAAALLVAAFHRLILKPATQQPQRVPATRARRFFARSLPLEALLAIAVLAAAAVLTNLPPANTDSSTSPIMTKTLGNLAVAFEIEPRQIGPNRFQVTLRQDGKPVLNADKVQLQAEMLDMDMGQSVVDLQSQPGGVYSAQSDALSMGGRWRISMLIRLPGQLDQRTSFDLQVK